MPDQNCVLTCLLFMQFQPLTYFNDLKPWGKGEGEGLGCSGDGQAEVSLIGPQETFLASFQSARIPSAKSLVFWPWVFPVSTTTKFSLSLEWNLSFFLVHSFLLFHIPRPEKEEQGKKGFGGGRKNGEKAKELKTPANQITQECYVLCVLRNESAP